MAEIKKETVLYNREKDGIEVEAKQTISEVVVQEATEDQDAKTKDQREYLITAKVGDRTLKEEAGTSYRETIKRARKVFKEVYAEHKPAEPVKEEEEEAETEEQEA